MQPSVNFITLQRCAICNDEHIELLWDLPAFPFTELYGTYSPSKCKSVNQQLMMCGTCGHVQLGRQVKPSILYVPSEYAFRTSQSGSAQVGCQVFFEFLLKISAGRTFNSLLDIGGNDRFLAKMVGAIAQEKAVIDPVCQPQHGQIIDGIKVFGRLIEEMDLRKDITQPDLVICRHVLEHISEPKNLLTKLFRECTENTLFVFEIPCFERLVEARRFDAIFHQHYHYYDLETFQRLIAEAGGEYIAHLDSYQGSCGGALLIAFRKSHQRSLSKPLSDISRKRANILAAIKDHQLMMQVIAGQLDQWRNQIYGYGASLMLATLAYHLQTDFSDLICVLDDDEQKDGIGYQNLPVKVRYAKKMSIAPNSIFLITSLENTRSIYQKVLNYQPRRILVPSII